MTKNVLIFGRIGQVGQELAASPWPFRANVTQIDKEDFDLVAADPAAMQNLFAENAPHLVVNAAAYTAVDQAESERNLAFALNAKAPQLMAQACAKNETPFIHISTDYVFDGDKDSPYVEDDPIGPVSVYGASKAEGEASVREALEQHVILRTAWVYSAHGQNFVKSMLKLGAERDRLTIVNDQTGCPTSAREIARAIKSIAGQILVDPASAPYGTYHYVGGQKMTWYDFAKDIFEGAEARGAETPAKILPIPTSDYPTAAKRPANSVLETAKIRTNWGLSAPPQAQELAAVLDRLLGPT